MSQDFVGSVGHRNDYGEFITIGEKRVRKEQIVSYGLMFFVDKDAAEKMGIPFFPYGIEVKTPGFTVHIPLADNLEVVRQEMQRLDWIFRGEK